MYLSMKSLQLFKKLGFACNTRICNPSRIRNPSSLPRFPYSSSIYPSSSTLFHPSLFFSSTSSNGGSEASKALKEAVNSTLKNKEYYNENGVGFRIVDLPRKKSDNILLYGESDGDTVQVLAQDNTSEASSISSYYRLIINIVKKDGRCMECICDSNTDGLSYRPRSVTMKRSKAESFSSLSVYDHVKNPVAFRSWDEATDYWLGWDENAYIWKAALDTYLEARGVGPSIVMLLEKYKRQKNNVNGKHVNKFVENKDVSTQASITGAKSPLQSSISIAPTSVNNLRDTAAVLKEALTNEIKRIKSSDEELHRHLLECDPNYVCPFEIVDNPGKYTPTFKREIDGDSIQVETGIGYKDIPYKVIIRMEDGTRLKYCTEEYDGTTMGYDSIWVERPEGWYKLTEDEDDGSELDKSMDRYLEWAGINELSFLRFLDNYTIIRLRREYIRLLKKVRNFV